MYLVRVLVLGSGLMGSAAAFDLARNDDVEGVIVADIDLGSAEAVAKKLGSKVEARKVDATKKADLVEVFSDVDAVVSCVSYKVNLLHTEAAIETATHLCDLGGNFKVVEKQLELDSQAKDAGITVVPDCGLAPGMVNVLVGDGISYLDKTDCVRIRVGGLPQKPRPPLNYAMVFSVEGLINEYVEPCMVLRDGKITYEDPLVGFEQVEFPDPFGRLETFNTSGGTSTLPLTYEGVVDNLDYKTIRYPGHGHTMWVLMKLGLMDSNQYDFDGIKISPRAVLEGILAKNLPKAEKDVTLMRISIEGWKGTESRKLEYNMVDYYDDETGLTSMMRTTAFPATTTAVMLADGRVKESGVLPPERVIPPEPFIDALRAKGIDIEKRVV